MTEFRTRSRLVFEVTVDSDWVTTVLMATLFVICGLLLAREMHNIARHHIVGEPPLRNDFFSIFDKCFEIVAAVMFFMFASRIRKRVVKIASALMGLNLAGGALLSCFHLSWGARHVADVIGSALYQIALVIFCVAIAEWFKSIIRIGKAFQPPASGQ